MTKTEGCKPKLTEYIRKKGSDCWHFGNCSHIRLWKKMGLHCSRIDKPGDTFLLEMVVSARPPRSGELCNEAKAKARVAALAIKVNDTIARVERIIYRGSR